MKLNKCGHRSGIVTKLLFVACDDVLTSDHERIRTRRAIRRMGEFLGLEPCLAHLQAYRLGVNGERERPLLEDFAEWLIDEGHTAPTVNTMLRLLTRLGRLAGVATPRIEKRKGPPRAPLPKRQRPQRMRRDVSDALPPLPAAGPFVPPKTVAELFEHGYYPRRLIQSSPKTVYHFRHCIKKFGEFLGRIPVPEDLSDELILAFLGSELRNGLEATTCNGMRKKLLALARFAARKRLIDAPDVPMLKVNRRLPTAWTPEEVGKILTAADIDRRKIGQVRASLWWRALVLTIYDSGVRVSALLKTPRDCLDLDAARLLIPAEVQKQKEDQLFFLAPDTVAALRAIDVPRRLVFQWTRAHTTLWYHFEKLLKAAGLPHTNRDKFHRLRRTSGTLAAIVGGTAAAQSHLGHSVAEMTKLYIDRSQLPDQRIVDRFPRPEGTIAGLIEGPVTSGGDA